MEQVVSTLTWLAFWTSIIGGALIVGVVARDVVYPKAHELPRWNRTRGWWKARRARRLHRRSGRA